MEGPCSCQLEMKLRDVGVGLLQLLEAETTLSLERRSESAPETNEMVMPDGLELVVYQVPQLSCSSSGSRIQ